MRKQLTIILVGLAINVFALNPSRAYVKTPDLLKINYFEYKIKTPDNYDINIWEYSILDNIVPTKTIIIVGPDAGNMSYLILQAKVLREKGIRVITFDYRGFGKSSNFDINKDNLYYSEFAIDLEAAIKHTRKKYPNEKLGLYGLSMGTYISLIREETIDFLVAEGFFYDPKLVAERLKLTKGKIVTLPSMADRICVLKPSVPILIFCATDDKITTTEDAENFRERNHVTIVELKGDHLAGFNILTKDSPGDQYADTINEFLVINKL